MRKLFCLLMINLIIQSSFANTIIGNSSVNIESALSITEILPLNFGEIILGHQGSDAITMGNSGQMSSVAQLATFNGSRTSGRFLITGTPNSTVNIQFNNFVNLLHQGNTLKLRAFTTEDRTPELNENGEVTINIGAKIIINPSQATGMYIGAYPITVSYQ